MKTTKEFEITKKAQKKKEIKHRHLNSHMIWSHIFIIAPCLWWIFGYNYGNLWSHIFDKIMAIILTLCITLSVIYHYYYEAVLCHIEEYTNVFGVIFLNIYMYYRGVPKKILAIGFIVLAILEYWVYSNAKYYDLENYEKNHAYAHYIGGLYVFFCVYFIEQSFIKQKLQNPPE